MYINCKTYFSLRYGTFNTEELVKKALESGIGALALTNINNTSDAWDFYQHCTTNGIKPILGAEIRNGDDTCYILLAANLAGFEWINEFLSIHLQGEIPFPEKATGTGFFRHPADGYVIYPFQKKAPADLLQNEFIGIQQDYITKLFSFPVKDYRHKLVVLQPVSFQDKQHYNAHRLLRAIQHNTLLSKLTAAQQGAATEVFYPPGKLIEAFAQYPFIITNTYQLIESIHLSFELHTDKNKKNLTATPEDDKIFLDKLAKDGCIQRYGKRNKTALERVNKELEVIFF